MRNISKKMLISILTSVIVFVTMVATTFAWVGIFTYANTDTFNLNLKVSDLFANYYLTISKTGQKGTFHDEIPAIDIKKDIVVQKYGDTYSEVSDSVIEQIFNSITLAPSTTKINDDNTIDSFTEINYANSSLEFKQSNGYYKFDLYLSVDTKEGISSETTGINSNVYLSNLENMIEGTITSGILSNGNPFLNLPSNEEMDILKTIPLKYKVNSKNAVRVGLSVYEPIPINDEYSSELPFKTIIYDGGGKKPTYNEITDCYDLGGCLPEEYNLAIKELLVTRPYYKAPYSIAAYNESFNNAVNRNDYDITEENSQIWNRVNSEKYLGCIDGVQTKMKITVYLWFEGWDADCLKLIEKQPISLSLTFTAGTDS